MQPALILARVSTPEQEAGHSLEAQLANLQTYADRRGLEVVQVWGYNCPLIRIMPQ